MTRITTKFLQNCSPLAETHISYYTRARLFFFYHIILHNTTPFGFVFRDTVGVIWDGVTWAINDYSNIFTKRVLLKFVYIDFYALQAPKTIPNFLFSISFGISRVENTERNTTCGYFLTLWIFAWIWISVKKAWIE